MNRPKAWERLGQPSCIDRDFGGVKEGVRAGVGRPGTDIECLMAAESPEEDRNT